MSQMHKVIILNKPMKIWDFTIIQWGMLSVAALLAFAAAAQVPKEVKINGMPGGAVAFICLICVALALVKMSEVKPWGWWKNMLAYRLKAVPTTWMPHPEIAPIYPDPTIIEAKKQGDDNYVEASTGR
jgi:hypothetical protein